MEGFDVPLVQESKIGERGKNGVSITIRSFPKDVEVSVEISGNDKLGGERGEKSREGSMDILAEGFVRNHRKVKGDEGDVKVIKVNSNNEVRRVDGGRFEVFVKDENGRFGG